LDHKTPKVPGENNKTIGNHHLVKVVDLPPKHRIPKGVVTWEFEKD